VKLAAEAGAASPIKGMSAAAATANTRGRKRRRVFICIHLPAVLEGRAESRAAFRVLLARLTKPSRIFPFPCAVGEENVNISHLKAQRVPLSAVRQARPNGLDVLSRPQEPGKPLWRNDLLRRPRHGDRYRSGPATNASGSVSRASAADPVGEQAGRQETTTRPRSAGRRGPAAVRPRSARSNAGPTRSSRRAGAGGSPSSASAVSERVRQRRPTRRPAAAARLRARGVRRIVVASWFLGARPAPRPDRRAGARNRSGRVRRRAAR